MKSLRVLGFAFLLCANSYAVTSQFRGVNWADKRDNFVSDVLLLSGTSLSDTYESASVIAERVIGQFQELLGTNSVRIPINEPTASKFWSTYTGIIDVGLSKGRVAIGYWGPAQPSGPKNMNDWWAMWETVVKKYGDHPNAYFEIFNEPHMYSKDELRNLYATWLEKFPDVPRDHILLDGSGLAWNVPDIADDPRFEGCLFAVHEYTFWNMSINTEQGWKNSFKGKVGKYIDRTVCTEWGGAMSPGEKAGVHYDYMDYNSTPTNYFMAYIRGMSDQLREWEMGSFYWPGLRDGDWYSMTKRSGEGANIKLEIVNQSGVDRMQMSWADTVETTPPQQDPFGGFDADGKAIAGKPAAIPGKIEAENYDLGGSRVSFYDKSSANEGGFYRKDAVDIVALDSADLSKGFALGYTQAGEWLEYTVNVEKTAKFTVEVQMATASEKAGVQLYIDNKAVSDSIIAKQGEDWSNYTAVQAKLGEIAAGEHVLKLQILGDYVNIDWLKFCEGEKCEESVGIRAIRTAAPGENASASRLRVQNNKLFVEKNGRHFDLTGHRIN
ncbi:MAG: carbohydrate-binding protein [Fibrobacter sp.]|nr:carbohydrate-binding protein [Fibrobacter sp.]